jgi:uncharacterized OsmC-like protein/alpha/beta superfamily hydrolase
MRSTMVTIARGLEPSLAARLELPAGPVRAYALFAHCFTCSKDLQVVRTISRELASRGIAVLRFDFTGLGESEGEFAATTFVSSLDDVVAAAAYLREHAAAPSLLVGHSLGGAAVIAAAARIPEATAVVAIGAPSDLGHLARTLEHAAPELASAPDTEAIAEVVLGGRPFQIRRRLLDELRQERIDEAVAGLGRALLVLHSPVDQTVGIDHARRIYERARHPKSFVSLDDADHLLTRKRDAAYAGEVIAAWASRYLPAEPTAATDERGSEIIVASAAGLTQDVEVRGHRLVADEPLAAGGDDRGPTPYDLLLAALGACTSMTLQLYARHKGWPLEAARVVLRHDKIHAKDCAHCATQTGKVDHIQRELELAGELDAEQRARLLEIADRCPVHRTLTSEVSIVTRLLGE